MTNGNPEASQQVAIINDDPSDRVVWSLQIEEAGYQPLVIEQPSGGSFDAVQQLLDEVEGRAKWAVCDHRLSPRGMAQFVGAEAVAAFNRNRQTPALLVTTWSKIDVDVSIRQYRRHVPVMLDADEFQDPGIIRSQLDACFREVVEGQVPPHRIPRKTLVRIEATARETNLEVVDAVIPGWNPNTKIRFPLVLIGKHLHEYVCPGAFFSAYVNRGAEREEDLFLESFELAPEANPNDGLA